MKVFIQLRTDERMGRWYLITGYFIFSGVIQFVGVDCWTNLFQRIWTSVANSSGGGSSLITGDLTILWQFRHIVDRHQVLSVMFRQYSFALILFVGAVTSIREPYNHGSKVKSIAKQYGLFKQHDYLSSTSIRPKLMVFWTVYLQLRAYFYLEQYWAGLWTSSHRLRLF
jgi:hypothetical protein